METSNQFGLINQAELAKLLDKSEAWTERSRWDGSGPPFVKIGKSVMYRVTDVEEWLAGRTRTSTSDHGRAASC